MVRKIFSAAAVLLICFQACHRNGAATGGVPDGIACPGHDTRLKALRDSLKAELVAQVCTSVALAERRNVPAKENKTIAVRASDPVYGR